MIDEATNARIGPFVTAKTEQWDRVTAGRIIPGLSLVTSGPGGSTFRMSIANDDISESVIFGKLPEQQIERIRKGGRIEGRVVPDDRKLASKLEIDLNDSAVAQVLERWLEGSSAHDLPAVRISYDSAGNERVKERGQ